MSDFEDDAGGWSDYDGDDYEDDQNDMVDDDAVDELEENVDQNNYEEADDGNAEVEQCVKIPKVLSLKENCLECITKNFERFNNAYLSSEDEVLRRHLEFLQRVFTSRVIHSLSGKMLLKDSYLEFLINQHLKELDLRVFADCGCTLEAIGKRIALVGKGFTKVSFDMPCDLCCYENLTDPTLCRISEFADAAICHLSNVQVLHIPQHCSDTTLKYISSFCTKLSELNIDGSCSVSGEGLDMVFDKHDRHRTERTKVLSVRWTYIKYSTIRFWLSNMPSLEVVNHYHLPIILHSMHKGDLKNNAKKYNLTELDFFYEGPPSEHESNIYDIFGQYVVIPDNIDRYENMEHILRVCVEVCPNIKTLLINVQRYGNYFNVISRFSNLENLTLKSEADTIGGHLDFANFLKCRGKNLRNLKVKFLALPLLTLIGSCPKLENLSVTDVEFILNDLTKEQSPNERSLTSLIELRLKAIVFTDPCAEDSAIKILLSSPNIEKLTFKMCNFASSEMSTKLANCFEDSTLKHLIFHYCDIELALLQAIILKCSSLISLTVNACSNVSSDGAFNLRQLGGTTRRFVEIVYIESRWP